MAGPTPGARLARLLREVSGGSPWLGPSLRDAVAGLDPTQAAARPVPGAHSIWELVLHTGTWAEVVGERLRGEGGPVPSARNFPAPPESLDATAWSAAVEETLARHETLAQQVEALGAEGWDRPLGGAGGSDAFTQVEGVVSHTAYHAGQIVVLRRALGVEPPAS